MAVVATRKSSDSRVPNTSYRQFSKMSVTLFNHPKSTLVLSEKRVGFSRYAKPSFCP